MREIETDICVIGAGSGGLSVAAGAAQMGARVVLIEKGEMGGDCLNTGCVPSKALLSEAGRAHAGQEVRYSAAMDHVRAVIDTIAPHDSQERFEGLGCTVIREAARFVSETEVEAGDARITARRFVVATGSRPFVPPIEGLDTVPYLTNETIFAQRQRPQHLIIIGGGNIGMEMAQAHVRLGSKVTVIEADKALAKDDPEMAQIVLEQLRAEGIRILEGARAERVSGSAGDITVHTGDEAITGTHLLVAVGRQVNVDGLGLDAARVKVDGKGIKVGDDLRSVSNRRVYAVGDVAGGMQFTHVAGYHGGIVVRSAVLGLPARARTAHIPWCTYTDPELAQVGLTEAEARKKHGSRLTVVRADFAGNDRAVATGKRTGFLKVMVVRGKPVGASIVGPGAGDLIGYWALAIANNLGMSALSNTVLPYPTLAEINKRAAGTYFSPKVFDSNVVKQVVRLVQRWLP